MKSFLWILETAAFWSATGFWQHECEPGIIEALQLPAIFSQHSRCCAVISAACAKHVESGTAKIAIARATDANWNVLLNIPILRLPANPR